MNRLIRRTIHLWQSWRARRRRNQAGKALTRQDWQRTRPRATEAGYDDTRAGRADVMVANFLLYFLVSVFTFFHLAGMIVSTVGAVKDDKTFWLFSFACGFIALMLARWGGI